jgi:hypothetical protein
MADLNALIAQGYQFQAPPDPFAQYGKMQQLENSATQNRLAQQQMAENAQLAPLRMREAQAKLNTADLTYEQLKGAQDFVAGVMTKAQENGSNVNDPMDAAMQMLSHPNPKVQEIGKHLAEAHQLVQGIRQQQAYAQGEPGTGAFAGVRATPAPGATPMPSQASAPVPLAPAASGDAGTPVLTGNALAPPSVNAMQPNRLEQIDKRLAVLRQFPKVPEAIQERADLVKERDRLMTPHIVGTNLVTLGGGVAYTAPEKTPSSVDATTMKALGYPLTPEGFAAFKDAQRQERMLNPAEEAQKIRIANASRPPGAPRIEPAPTVTSIQDPTNPNQMISINARDYKGGGVGSPGVIGLTGKTPAATAKQDAVDKGQAQLVSVVDDLRASYDTLERAAAIPSTKRGAVSNLASSVQASGFGQALGRYTGTEEQSARDTINSSRMMLLNAIKQATGMSAQQLNSNVELTSWLKAVSDPTQSIETVNNILGNIEKFVESGGKYSAKKEAAVPNSGKLSPAEEAELAQLRKRFGK